MELIVRPHLLSTRDAETVQVPAGPSIAEIVAMRSWPPGVEPQLCALVNGYLVPRDWWHRVHPKEGARVTLAVRLQGGGGGGGQQSGGKTIMRLVAVIVLTIVAQGAGAAYASTLGVSETVLTAGIMLVGSLALNAIFKPPSIDISGGDSSNAYTFGGQSNSIRPYGVIPRVLGTHRMYGDVVANPYTEVEGNDTYLVGVYCFGYGPCDVNDIRIGENPIGNYTPHTKVHPAFKAGDALEIYKSDATQEALALQLVYNVGTVITTRPNSSAASFDLTYNQGLCLYNNRGGVEARTSFTRVEFKRFSDPDNAWQLFPKAVAWSFSESSQPRAMRVVIGTYEYFNDGNASFVLLPGTTEFQFNELQADPPSVGANVSIAGHNYTVTDANDTYFYIAAPGIVEPYYIGTYNVLTVYFTEPDGVWTVTRARTTPFPTSMSLTFPQPPDQWQIRITQLEPNDEDPNKYMHLRTVTALRSITTGAAPIKPDKPITLLEIRIKATEQLSGVVQNLNALVSAKIPAWDGSAWVETTTSNPAWQYLEVLRGVANNRPVQQDAPPVVTPIEDNTRIDLDAIKAWGAWCDTIRTADGFTQPNARCNFVVDKRYTLWELLSSIAANGRAMPTMRDNKYSVIVDTADKTPVQIFTPRNSWNLSARRKYLDVPHALRVSWVDPAIGYQQSQVAVFNDGYNESNATVYEELPTFGVTSHEQAHREGRIALARGRLQQEEFSITTDVENIICMRGDMIGIAHDVLEVGGWSARLASINGNVVSFDAELKPFDPPLAMRHRSDAGVLSAPLAMTPMDGAPGYWRVDSFPTSAHVGDLVIYGTVDQELGWYLVKGVQPGDDLTAEITCIEYAPGIYQAEAGAIPPYVPQDGSVGQINPQPVAALTASKLTYLDGRYTRADVLLRWSPPQGTSIPPSVYIISAVRDDGTTAEVGRTSGLSFTAAEGLAMWTTPWGDSTVTFEVAGQWPGLRGPGHRVSLYLGAVVQPLPLDPVEGVTATPHARGVFVEWPAIGEPDLAYYVVRYGAPGDTWAAMAASEQRIKSAFVDLLPEFLAGTWQVQVAAEDRWGGRSSAVAATFKVERPKAITIVGSAVLNTAYLRWGSLVPPAAGSWSAQTTFQIEYYDLIKTKQEQTREDYVLPNDAGTIPAGIVTAQDLADSRAATPVALGKYAAEFAVLNEQQEGLWQYCVRGVDVAGNMADYACLTLLVNAPNDYLLLDSLANILPTPECTKTNAVQNTVTGEWLAPIDTAQTWKQHYEANAWDQPQDQVAAGFPMYAQPAASAKGVFSWSHDYGQNLPALKAHFTPFFTTYGGTPTVTVIVYSKANAGDAWVEVGRSALEAVVLLPPGTRYVRCDVEVTTDAARKALAVLQRIEYIMDVQFRDDSGTATTASNGQGNVVFNVKFLDVRSVQVSPADQVVAYAQYVLAPDEKSMTVYSFNASAQPVAGKVSWFARGV